VKHQTGHPLNTLSSFDSPLVRFPLASSGSSSRGLAQDDRVFPLASRFWRDTENVVSTGALRIRKFKTTFFPHLFSHRCKVQQAIQETAMTFPAICHPEAEPCSLSKAYTQLVARAEGSAPLLFRVYSSHIYICVPACGLPLDERPTLQGQDPELLHPSSGWSRPFQACGLAVLSTLCHLSASPRELNPELARGKRTKGESKDDRVFLPACDSGVLT
jgi:hypothetical protein